VRVVCEWICNAGRAFDWSIAKEVQEKTPIFVAGGLGPQNVADAVSASAPLGVDVRSVNRFVASSL
jgi:phosphoribosylanthranilate isomerase